MAITYGAPPYVFESGFENELTDDFEGTRVTPAGAKLERVTNVFHHASHSLHVVAPPRSNSLQYAWINFGHVTEIYVRFYVYFPDGSLFLYPDAWAGGKMEYWLYFLGGLAYLEADGTEPRCNRTGAPLFTWGSLRLIYFEESVDRPEGYYFSGTTWSESGNRVYAPFNTPTPDAFPIETGRWYCLEVHHKMASGLGQNDGLAELWVDGTFENGNYTSSPYLQAYNIANYEPEAPYYGAIEIGNREIPPSSTPDTTPNLEIYIDCLKIDTEPIGTEPDEDSPPTIGSPTQEPTTVTSSQNVTVSVSVTDESGVLEVILSYSTNESATWTNVTMNPAAGNVHEGDIPGFLFGTNVSYIIIAYDNLGNVAVKDNEGEYYVYMVILEDSPPTIGSPIQEPTTVTSSQNVTVSVSVTDESGVLEVILSYSTDEGATWTNVTMSKVAGDVYEGGIPGFSYGTNVSYIIIAYDIFGNDAVKPNTGQYYVYEVIPEFSTWPVFLATLILITIFMVFMKKRLSSSRL